jgi:hypothetical protein
MVLYIKIFMFLERNGKTRDPEQTSSKHSPNLTFSEGEFLKNSFKISYSCVTFMRAISTRLPGFVQLWETFHRYLNIVPILLITISRSAKLGDGI